MKYYSLYEPLNVNGRGASVPLGSTVPGGGTMRPYRVTFLVRREKVAAALTMCHRGWRLPGSKGNEGVREGGVLA
ncbi:hypothetical protein E2C01_043139 [Portunus trituberculatus]|uniref:Uncharacterized protein n=1 Tax=Portunus trituberculatus TaxID=210409 RepID=A0A5B7FPG6_PORTR|nr:hypothetical protein [Portunus trituberculatus]